MDYRILGPLEVRADGRSIDLGRPKQRAVLAVLLLSANRVVSLDRLIELLWGDEAPGRATGAVQAYVSNLRRVLEPSRAARAPASVLVTQPPGYLLQVGPGELDSVQFEALAERGHRRLAEGRPRAARHDLVAALGLWRGPALAEFAFEGFAQAEAARLEELRAGVAEDRLEVELALGNHGHVVGELEAAVGERPLRERLWGLLVLALYRSGRQGEALRAYARARAVLGEELGIEPSPGLRQLEADVLAQSPSLEWRRTEFEEPATVVNGASDLPSTEPAAVQGHGQELPAFVGRDGALATLDAALAEVRGGTGRVVLVSGEPGIGKTRLVEEFAHRAEQDGALVAWGRSYEGEGAPPFWPWLEVLRDLLGTAALARPEPVLASQLARIAQIVPEASELVGDVAPPPPLDPASARFRLYESVAGLLGHLSSARPLVVVIDDLQWADPPSLQLIEFLAGHIGRTRLLVACTYRDVDPLPHDALLTTLAVVARQPTLDRIPLKGLDEAAVGVFMARTAGIEFDGEVTAAVRARTNGNPFFVGELARYLAAESAAGPPTATATAAAAEGSKCMAGGALSVGAPPIPVAVRDVIRRRLARLSPRTAELLGLAAATAATGQGFDLRVVAAAAGRDIDDALEAVEPAVDIGVLVEDAAAVGHYRFSHALVQETVYRELPGLRRAHLHGRIVEVLSRLAETEARVAELAHHAYLAVPARGPEDAFRYALRAAGIAQARLAYEQAERHLLRALELAEAMEAPECVLRELEALNRLGALYSLTKGYHAHEVTGIWSRAQRLCGELGAGPEVLATLWGQARAARARGQLRLSYELGERLLDLAGSPDTSAQFLVAGRETCGIAALYKGDLVEAAEHLSGIGPQAERCHFDPSTGALVMHPLVLGQSYLALTRWLQGADGEAVVLASDAITLARRDGTNVDRAVALLLAVQLALLRSDRASILPLTGEIARLAAASGAASLAIMARAAAAWAKADRGEAQSGLDECTQALLELEATGWRVNWTHFLGLLADTFRLAGRPDAALVTLREALTEVHATGERFYEAELHRYRGEILAEVGAQPADVEAALVAACDVARSQGAMPFLERAEASLRRLCARAN